MKRVEAKRLGKKLKKILPESAEEILRGVKVPGSGRLPEDFMAGGCLIFAKAFAKWAGPSAEVMGVWWTDYDFEDDFWHVVVRIDDWLFDQSGASTVSEIVSRYAKHLYETDSVYLEDQGSGGYVVARVEEDRDFGVWIDAFTRSSGIACSPKSVRRLEELLKSELGKPADWGISRWNPGPDEAANVSRNSGDEQIQALRRLASTGDKAARKQLYIALERVGQHPDPKEEFEVVEIMLEDGDLPEAEALRRHEERVRTGRLTPRERWLLEKLRQRPPVTLRLYRNEDESGIVEKGPDLDADVELRGWDHQTGQRFMVGGDAYTLSSVGTSILTTGSRSEYILAEAVSDPTIDPATACRVARLMRQVDLDPWGSNPAERIEEIAAILGADRGIDAFDHPVSGEPLYVYVAWGDFDRPTLLWRFGLSGPANPAFVIDTTDAVAARVQRLGDVEANPQPAPIKVLLEHGRDGWWRAYVWGRSAPILRPVPGNLYPASAATWATAEEATAELPSLLNWSVEIVRRDVL